MKSKYLVCGAGGFIGGHLVKSLLDDGHEVICADVKPLENCDWTLKLALKAFRSTWCRLATGASTPVAPKNKITCFLCLVLYCLLGLCGYF